MYTGKKSKNMFVRRQWAHAQVGMTLLEVLMAFSLLLIGLISIFKVATVANSSNVRTRQFQIALTKAQDVMELVKELPTQTLACLAGGTSAAGCYGSCVSANADPQTCAIALGTDVTWYRDPHGTVYTPTLTATVSSFASTYDVQVVVSWMGVENPPKTHNVILKTMVYRP